MSEALKRWGLAWALGLLALVGVLWPHQVRWASPRLTPAPWFTPLASPTSPLPNAFRLVFIADLPPPGQEALMEAFLEDMAVVKPQAILVGGDLAYGEQESWYRYLVAKFDQLQAMGIQMIVAPGNHERKSWVQYLRAFGSATDHRVDLGPLAILSLDSAHGRDRLTPRQFRWLRAQLDSLGGRTPILQIHHPIFPLGKAILGEAGGTGGYLQGFRQPLIDLCEARKVPIVLSGHWHSDAVFDGKGELRDDTADFPGTKFVVTTALGNELRRVTRWPHVYYGYRILDFEGGRLVRYTHDLEGKGQDAPIASTPLGQPRQAQVSPR